MSFVDSYYYTKIGRQLITDCFEELNIKNLTHSHISSTGEPASKLLTITSAGIRVPFTSGMPDTLPGITSTSSHPLQSIALLASTVYATHLEW